jgi:hypothetical protein
LEGLSVGPLTGSPVNATYSSVAAPLTFTDASSFVRLNATMSGTIMGPSGAVVGTIAPVAVTADPGQQVSATVSGFIQTAAVGQGSYVLHLTIGTQYGTMSTEVTATA